MPAYDNWAPYYDLLHPGLPGEAEFYVGQAVRLGGAALELGCGTGRIAIPMAMCGVDVTGLDHSAAMLDVCNAKREAAGPLKGRLELVEADMRDFQLGRSFAYVALPYRSFMHLLTPPDQLRCLEAVFRHLDPEGVFILNYWLPNGARHTQALQSRDFRLVEEMSLDDGEIRLFHYHRMSIDPYRQRIRDEHLLEERGEEGKPLHTLRLPLERAWLQPEEMRDRAQRVGFQVETVFQDFDCRPCRGPGEMIWVLRKP